MTNASASRQQTSDSSPGASDPDPDPDDAEQPSRLPKDTLFAILENRRRREALRYLRRNDGVGTLSDLAEHIAARENDVDVTALSSDERKRVYIALYQCHLPKMATAGVVDFDKNRGTVELRAAAEQFGVYLDDDVVGSRQGPPTRRNLAIAGGIAACLVASVVGVPGFALVPGLVWATLSIGVLVALTAIEARRTASTA